MRVLFYSTIALLSLANFGLALTTKDLTSDEVELILKDLSADMHFIDKLYSKVMKTGIKMDIIFDFEGRSYLANGIVDYIETISGGGPKQLILDEKDPKKARVYKTEMDKKVFVNWYLWSVQGLCRRLVDVAEPLVSQLKNLERFVNDETKQLIAKTKICRAIVDAELLNDSYELVKSRYGKLQDIILLP